LSKGFKGIALHTYADKDHKPLYYRIRLKHPKTGEKWIRPICCNKEGVFVLKELFFPDKKPLYRLPDILSHPDETIWITEGELCADRLAKFGLVATTSGGVDSVSKTDWTPLANKKIMIWPDNDSAGSHYAQAIYQQLHILKCQVQWIDVAALNLPPKGDCVNWLLNHPMATQEDIQRLPCLTPSTGVHQDTPPTSIITHNEQLSNSFIIKDSGIFYNENEVMEWVCAKLTITAFVRDPLSENWGRLLEFYDNDGKLHQWVMPMEMLKSSGDELRGNYCVLGWK